MITQHIALKTDMIEWITPDEKRVWCTVAQLAERFGLVKSGCYAVANGTRLQHRGFRRAEATKKVLPKYVLWRFGTFYTFSNAQEFAEEHGISAKEVRKVLRGERKSYHNFTKEEDKSVTFYHKSGEKGTKYTLRYLGASTTIIAELLQGVRKHWKGWKTEEWIYHTVFKGQIIHRFSDVHEWARENGLDSRQVRRLLAGQRQSYKGYTMKKHEHLTFYHSSGKIAVVENLAEWCKANNYGSPAPFYSVLNGKRASHLGWSKRRTTVITLRHKDGRQIEIRSVTKDGPKFGLDPSNLSKLLRGKLKTTGGWSVYETEAL